MSAPAADKLPRCAMCAYVHHVAGRLQCRRNPPLAVTVHEHGIWPYVLPEQWCGEWAAPLTSGEGYEGADMPFDVGAGS